MRKPKKVSYYQYSRHGFSEVLDVLRGPNGPCQCSATVPVEINAPFYYNMYLPYDPANRQYLVKGYCKGCRYHAEAFVDQEVMPRIFPEGLMHIMMEFDSDLCNHMGALYITHLVHDWEDSHLSDHYVVHCRKCRKEIEVELDEKDAKFT